MAKSDYKISQADWQYVKNIMVQYNRTYGFVDVIETNNCKYKLEFFDSDPYLDNCNALYITINCVDDIIDSYEPADWFKMPTQLTE
jgi:hypothetical protein